MDKIFDDIQESWTDFIQDPEHYFDKRNKELLNMYPEVEGVTDCQGSQAILRLFKLQTPLELFTEIVPQRRDIPRYGDLLVGVIPKHSGRLSITIASNKVAEIEVQADVPTLILETTVIPLIAMVYHIVKIDFPDQPGNLTLIYGALDNNERRLVATTPLYLPLPSSGYMRVEGGMGFPVETPLPADAIVWPILGSTPYWKKQAEKKAEWLRTIEQELMERAWHPSRLIWCLDMEDAHLLLS